VRVGRRVELHVVGVEVRRRVGPEPARREGVRGGVEVRVPTVLLRGRRTRGASSPDARVLPDGRAGAVRDAPGVGPAHRHVGTRLRVPTGRRGRVGGAAASDEDQASLVPRQPAGEPHLAPHGRRRSAAAGRGEGPAKKGKSIASRGETSSSPVLSPPLVLSPADVPAGSRPAGSRLTLFLLTLFVPSLLPPAPPGMDATSGRMSYTMPSLASGLTTGGATGESSSPASAPVKSRDLCPFLAVRAGPGTPTRAPAAAGGELCPKAGSVRALLFPPGRPDPPPNLSPPRDGWRPSAVTSPLRLSLRTFELTPLTDRRIELEAGGVGAEPPRWSQSRHSAILPDRSVGLDDDAADPPSR
ncbi:hypothetical protein THAOC_15490, partial [Thalassiosira oceanica]